MLLAVGFAVLLGWPQDSVSVRTSLTADRIAAGSTTVLTIEVTTAGITPDEIPAPLLPPGLQLGQISDFSQLQVAFPGGRRRITRREVAIIATAPGTYRIPGAEITVGGTRMRTRQLQLVVVGTEAARWTAVARHRCNCVPGSRRLSRSWDGKCSIRWKPRSPRAALASASLN
jgi:hypothetical protein